jgi:glyoxylate reductase
VAAKLDVLVTRAIPETGLALLRSAPEIGRLDVSPHDRPLSREELIELARDRDGIVALLTDRIDGPLLDAAGPRLKVVANFAVGYDNVDVPAATARGVLITNTPGALTEATADLTFALLLAAARRVVEADRAVREGRFRSWGPLDWLGADVHGRTLGVVGAGRIGEAVARRARGFDMRILYVERGRKVALDKLGARAVDLETLLRESDFVSLHLPLSRETRHLIDARALARMKPSAVLVNTARGAIVDEAALVAALRERRIAAAGLDVYEDEPALAPGLAALDNVVLAPHMASATHGARGRMAALAAQGCLSALRGERPAHLVNPEAWPGRARTG